MLLYFGKENLLCELNLKNICSIKQAGAKNCNYILNEPAHEIMVLITEVTSKGSDEPAHPQSLARAFAVRT